ncbi:MAG: glutathione peroxidase [Pseudomonadota bacterium]
MAEIYDFDVDLLNGDPLDMDALRGKVLLIVNVASKCGFTPQYEGLEALYRRRKAQGLEIIGFPCNQFGAQEPGDAKDIAAFCSTQFDVSFPIAAKIDVNGADAHPLYKWIKGQKKGLAGTRDIKWNFTKFLVDREGEVASRFGPQETPSAFEPDIQKLL